MPPPASSSGPPMVLRPFSRNIIAMIWDFDKTLIPGYMQDVLFKEYGVEGDAFWAEVNALPQQYQARGCGQVTTELLYLNHILDYAADGRFKGLSNARLKELGAKLEFYPGLPAFFPRIRRLLDDAKYRRHELKLEHYVVSTGLKKLVEGCALAEHLDGIWGCEFLEDEDSGCISRIGYVLEDTTKTRAVFEINKGVNVSESISVNDWIDRDKRRVPFEQMIYIADGPSDVPVFSVVKHWGGRTFAVYNPQERRKFDGAYKLQQQDRVHGMAEADYSPGRGAALWLEKAVIEIADRIVFQREWALHQSAGRAPTHRD